MCGGGKRILSEAKRKGMKKEGQKEKEKEKEIKKGEEEEDVRPFACYAQRGRRAYHLRP